MQPLEYKIISDQKHLTFDSIRRYVLRELSDLSAQEAKSHIDVCSRCNGIHQSLAYPTNIIKKNHGRLVSSLWWITAAVLIVGLGVTAFLYWTNTSSKAGQMVTPGEVDPELTIEGLGNRDVEPVMEAIDTLAQINEEPDIEEPIAAAKKFDQYIEEVKDEPSYQVRGIYGKVTRDGQPLAGVTVMIPGSNKARISDATGKYYIQVPRSTGSLIFIYQGKQLRKVLDPNSRRLDLQLRTEEMVYPSRESTSSNTQSDSIGQ